MLLKLRKEAFVLAVIGISFSFIFFVLLLLDVFGMHFLRYLNTFNWMLKNREFNIFIFLVMIVIGSMFIFKPNMAMAIISLICSILACNVFVFIASILVMVKINTPNQRLKEMEEDEYQEKENVYQDRIENTEVAFENPNRDIKKELPTHLEFSSSEQTRIALGITMASLYLVIYAIIVYFILRADYSGEQGAWLSIYAIFFLFILTAYVVVIVFNIVVSAIALNKKTISSTKVMKVFGFISLTFFNSIAARHALERIYREN